MSTKGDRQIRSDKRARHIQIHVRVNEAEYQILMSKLKLLTSHLSEDALKHSRFTLPRLLVDCTLEREIKPVVLPAQIDLKRLGLFAAILEKNGALMKKWMEGKGVFYAEDDIEYKYPLHVEHTMPAEYKKFAGKLLSKMEEVASTSRNIIKSAKISSRGET